MFAFIYLEHSKKGVVRFVFSFLFQKFVKDLRYFNLTRDSHINHMREGVLLPLQL
jgi:hypothetical protein